MKIGIIDLGTNNFSLVIAELINNLYHEIIKERIYVSLGKENIEEKGTLEQGFISSAAKERALDAMLAFKKHLKKYEVEATYAVATSAIRNAQNGDELIAAVFEATQIPVKIISGQEEAALIYEGVKKAVNINHQDVLIMDIGGGSVEFIICNASQPLWAKSFEIGAQRMLDQYHQGEIILASDLAKMHNDLSKILMPLFEAVQRYHPKRLIGSSGAFGTLADIYMAKYKPVVDPNATSCELPFDRFIEIYHSILFTDKAQRLQIPGLSRNRIDMIVVSSTLVEFILRKTQITAITASKYALKEGLFFEIMNRERASKNKHFCR
jgi:exopolyphosphatase/guanosine-5'-triphosphate,3'-diphosphate pyrophosphatase